MAFLYGSIRRRISVEFDISVDIGGRNAAVERIDAESLVQALDIGEEPVVSGLADRVFDVSGVLGHCDVFEKRGYSSVLQKFLATVVISPRRRKYIDNQLWICKRGLAAVTIFQCPE